MGHSFVAELFKLRKRPAVWVLGMVFALVIVLLNYLLGYAFVVGVQGDPPPEAEQFLSRLYPENVLPTTLGSFASFGGAIAVILGALVAGSEYGWDTLKAVLSRRQSRLGFLSGKLLALGAVVVIITPLIFLVGAVSSYTVASLQDAAANWPSFGDILRGAGVGWLILATFAAMGFFLATLFRGTSLAIGLGLVYLLVLENLFLGIPTENETFRAIGKALPGRNSLDLANSFGEPPPQAQGTAPQLEAVEPTQAALVLGVYTVGFLLLAALLFQRRDVT